MSKVVRVVVSPATDTVMLDIGNGFVVPYTYYSWGGDDAGIKKNFTREVEGGEQYGIEVGIEMFRDELEDPSARTIYTAEDGWLI